MKFMFSPPIVGCLLIKGFQKGGSQTPQEPPLPEEDILTQGNVFCLEGVGLKDLSGEFCQVGQVQVQDRKNHEWESHSLCGHKSTCSSLLPPANPTYPHALRSSCTQEIHKPLTPLIEPL